MRFVLRMLDWVPLFCVIVYRRISLYEDWWGIDLYIRWVIDAFVGCVLLAICGDLANLLSNGDRALALLLRVLAVAYAMCILSRQ